MKIPYYKQETDYSCGAACLRMALAACGVEKTEKDIVEMFITFSGQDTRERHEEFPSGAAKNAYFGRVAKLLGLPYKTGANSSLSELKSLLEADYAIIVGYFYETEDVGHYAVVDSINATDIFLLDPEAGAETKYPLEYFEKMWFSDPRDDNETKWFAAIRKSL